MVGRMNLKMDADGYDGGTWKMRPWVMYVVLLVIAQGSLFLPWCIGFLFGWRNKAFMNYL